MTFIIAEIGINHNGNVDIAKQLIDVAKEAGCNAVKFQKRTVEKLYKKEYLDSYRKSPWGTTQRDQKLGLEFSYDDYCEIDRYCRLKGIEWFASCWDIEAVDFIEKFNPKRYKIASPCARNDELIKYIARLYKHIIISTGTLDYDEIHNIANILQNRNVTLMHCVSCYPCDPTNLNLFCIQEMKEIFYECDIGYSGHEIGLQTTLAAVALGATYIERHITLDRAMYGSDQAASLEPGGLRHLVRDIRVIEGAMGNGIKKILPCEEETMKKFKECMNI